MPSGAPRRSLLGLCVFVEACTLNPKSIERLAAGVFFEFLRFTQANLDDLDCYAVLQTIFD